MRATRRVSRGLYLQTLRRMVILVAMILALMVWADRMRRRRAERLAQATWHATNATHGSNYVSQHILRAKVLRASLKSHSARLSPSWTREIVEESEAIAEKYTAEVQRHLDLEKQYQYLADRPWLATPRELNPIR